MTRTVLDDDLRASDYLRATHTVLQNHAASAHEVSMSYLRCKLAEYFTHDAGVRNVAVALAEQFAARMSSSSRERYERKAQTLTDLLDKAFAKEPKDVTIVVQVPPAYRMN